MFFLRATILLIPAMLCACAPQQAADDGVIARGTIAAVNESRIMMQGASHVFSISLDNPDPALTRRARAGQSITLLGTTTRHPDGGSSEILRGIELEDGSRFWVSN